MWRLSRLLRRIQVALISWWNAINVISLHELVHLVVIQLHSPAEILLAPRDYAILTAKFSLERDKDAKGPYVAILTTKIRPKLPVVRSTEIVDLSKKPFNWT